jgi:FkbM family methyltransferase
MSDANRECIARTQGVFLDIGAHHGFYTKYAGAEGRRVYAFEPHPTNLAVLAKAVADMDNVVVVPKAVSNSSGRTTLIPCTGNPGGHTISELVGKQKTWGHDHKLAFQVECVTIDDFVEAEGIERVGGIKIDVEGAEQQVLEGMEKTLVRFSPMIALETHQTIDTAAIASFLERLGYQDESSRPIELDKQYLLIRG